VKSVSAMIVLKYFLKLIFQPFFLFSAHHCLICREAIG